MKHWTSHSKNNRTYGWSGRFRRLGWRLMVWKHASYLGDRWVLQPTIHFDRKSRA